MVAALHKKQDGTRKRSAKTIHLMAFEAGIGHSLRLSKYGLETMHDELAECFALRRIAIPKRDVFQQWAVASAPTAGSTVEQLRAWLQREIRGTKDNYLDASLRCSHMMLSKGTREQRYIGSEQQMLFWAALWKSEMIVVKQSKHGLGLVAATRIAAGTTVARGVTDCHLWWPELETIITDVDGKRSAMFGPISMINSACSKHANAEFEHMPRGVVKAVATRTIPEGAEVYVQYPNAGVLPCVCSCGAKILQRRQKDGE